MPLPDPLHFLSQAPPAAVLPLLLLFFSFVTRLVVHEQPFVEFVHSIPPRIALAAAGIALAAVLSPTSVVVIRSGQDQQRTSAAVLVLFLTFYVAVEGMHAAARKGGAKQLWTIVSGGLAFAAATLATHYAQP